MAVGGRDGGGRDAGGPGTDDLVDALIREHLKRTGMVREPALVRRQ
jgi:hypothetical protein